MNENKKSFWSKPEGFTGTLFLAGLGIAGIMLWSKIVPFLLLMVTNTIYLVAGLAILGILLYVIIDPSFRNLAWYLYKSTMKKITSVFIQMDPIGIMKTYLTHLKEKQEEMFQQVEKLAQEIGVLSKTINNNQNTIQKNLDLRTSAIKQNNEPEANLALREIGRMTDSNAKLNKVKVVMSKMQEQLELIHKNSSYFIRDMESEIRVKEVEYKALKASTNAIHSAKSIINGDLNKKMMFDESLELLSDDMGRRVGEIEFFMKTSSSFIEKMDLQNGIYDEEGFRALEKMNMDFLKPSVIEQGTPVIDIQHQVISEPKKTKFI